MARSDAPAFVVMIRYDVAEIDLLAVVVGELAMVHDLQQHVEKIRVRLLDFVEQQHAMRMLIDAIGEQAALVEADIAGRRADQARNGVPFHVFRHVEADELDAERRGKLLCDFGLADAGGTGKQIASDRLLGLAQAGARELDRRRERLDRLVLAVDDGLQGLLEMPQHLGIVLGHCLWRDACHRRYRRLDFLETDRLLATAFGQEHLRRAGFIDHVDRLVRQLSVVNVARRQVPPRP